MASYPIGRRLACAHAMHPQNPRSCVAGKPLVTNWVLAYHIYPFPLHPPQESLAPIITMSNGTTAEKNIWGWLAHDKRHEERPWFPATKEFRSFFPVSLLAIIIGVKPFTIYRFYIDIDSPPLQGLCIPLGMRLTGIMHQYDIATAQLSNIITWNNFYEVY